MSKLKLSFVILMMVFASAATPARSVTEPRLEVEETALAFTSGVEGTEKVVFLGVVRSLEGSTSVRRTVREVVEIADGDGAFRLELEEPVPLQSVWVAVDITHGGFAVADVREAWKPWWEGAEEEADEPTPEPPPGAPRGRGLGSARSGQQGNRLILPSSRVEVTLVRAGSGVWAATIGDGTELDAGPPEDGQVAVVLARLAVLSGLAEAGEPPPRLAAGDVVVAMESDSLYWSVTTFDDTTDDTSSND